MPHRWSLVKGEWFVVCDENKKDFSCKIKCFQELGTCPYCGKNARLELEKRKKKKEENRREKYILEKQLNKGKLSGYF
jgi:rRNA maturation endonuclease Nob1